MDIGEHHAHLANALIYALPADSERRANTYSWAQKNFTFAIKGCREAMTRRVGVSQAPNSVLGMLIRRRENDWLPDIVTLWDDYQAAGMIDVDASVSVDDAFAAVTEKEACPSGYALPLEAAIVRGNVRMLQRLLDSGADLRKVPSCHFNLQLGHPWERRAGPVTDILSFIDCKVQESGLASALRAVVIEHMLKTGMVINGSETADTPPESGVESPRRPRIV